MLAKGCFLQIRAKMPGSKCGTGANHVIESIFQDCVYRWARFFPLATCLMLPILIEPRLPANFNSAASLCSFRDYLGFFFGLASILTWMVAQFPQIISNIRNKSAEALSPWFLAEWLMVGNQKKTTSYPMCTILFCQRASISLILHCLPWLMMKGYIAILCRATLATSSAAYWLGTN